MVETKKSSPRYDKSTQVYSALGVAFVCIVIGVPLWWKTTETYRVSLPYSHIAELAAKETICSVDVTIVIFDERIDKKDLSLFGENLKEALEGTSGSSGLKIKFRGNLRDAYEDEQMILKRSLNLEDLDREIDREKVLEEHGKYSFYIIPANDKLFPGTSDIYIGRRRNVYLHMKSPALEDLNRLVPILKPIIRDKFVNVAALVKTFESASGAQHLETDKASMRAVHSNPGYDVTFTLLNPQPDILNVQWDIKRGVEKFLQPFIEKLMQFASITVKSQMLYYTRLAFKPKHDKNNGRYFLKQEDLPHLINPIEAKLGSHVSNNPNLNFVVYIPTRDQSPLHIYDEKDFPTATNSFLSPRWGGVLLHNMPSPQENTTLPAQVQVDMKAMMEVFLAQLKMLLGFPQAAFPQADVALPDNSGILLWELDYWLRYRTLENIATSTATLKSLAQLLEQIGNIVINDDIGREVQHAVEEIDKCHTLLKQNKLKEAFLSSKEAIVASEKAFFDPSLLELLYFPEDQKFAIYIPLFLPISIPVFMSVIQAIKYFRGKDKEKKE